jgi:hypothetical protein
LFIIVIDFPPAKIFSLPPEDHNTVFFAAAATRRARNARLLTLLSSLNSLSYSEVPSWHRVEVKVFASRPAG